MGDLTEHFSRKEMMCKCGCKICNVDTSLLDGLEELRKFCGGPITIISGCRCPTHNKNEGGKAKSQHITTEKNACKASDIRCHSHKNLLLEGALHIFPQVGIKENAVHVDVDWSKPRNYWIYPKILKK